MRRRKRKLTQKEKVNRVETKGGVWDKQCEDCRWIYVKFNPACPKCGSVEGDLVGNVNDPDGTERESNPPYLPTPEEIRQRCEEIREDWDEDRLKHQERFENWKVPVSLLGMEFPDET